MVHARLLWFFPRHLLKSVWVYEYELETEQCNILVPENKRISRETSWYFSSNIKANLHDVRDDSITKQSVFNRLSAKY